ncbi:MAG TPA: prolyl oligopeptidase family serine peptidase [Acidimicrobiales bacterium]|nr:prolyl oligopeptidase family serine peptidase [Acidimicrobiales bacterium]
MTAPRLSAAMCTVGRTLADPVLSPDGWEVAFVDRVGGSSRLVTVPAHGGPEVVVSADLAPAGRGGVVGWFPDGSRLAYATGAGQVAVVPAGGGRPVVAWDGAGRSVGAVAVSPCGDEVAFVVDTAEVVVASADGRRARTVWSGAGFVVDPAWSSGGLALAWHEWDVPAMAWDESRIRLVPATGGGAGRVVAGRPGVSVQQPRFSPDGRRLGWLSDEGGWLTVHVAGADGRDPRPLVDEAFEHGGPTWGPGQRSWAWSPDGTAIAFERNEGGFGRLCVAPVTAGSGPVRELSRGVHGSLSWAGDRLACLRSGARTPTMVVTVDPTTGQRAVVARGPVGGFGDAGLVEPEPVTWPGDGGASVPGRLYRPAPARAGGGGGRPPPLLLWVHGGPTDQRRVSWDPSVAFFVDRGWAVLVPDARGTTGWGRAWAQALAGGWGVVDVADLAAGLAAAARRGWGDPHRMVPVGSSAGGSAVLWLLAAHPELCAAGLASFPVSDLAGLAATTARFEAHYPTSLVGPLPAAAERYRERSPLHQAERIRGPLLLLHGSADDVVPASQSAALAAAVTAAGGLVEHHVYEGEGHGWRSAVVAQDVLARMERFLGRHVAPCGRMAP